MSSKVARGKRARSADGKPDPNKRPNKRAKAETDTQNLFDTLHDELIINILVHLPIETFAASAQVCRRWFEQSTKQEFWKLSASKRWTSLLPTSLKTDETGSVIVDLSKYFIPTLKSGTKNIVDWRGYFKRRLLLDQLNQVMQEYYAMNYPNSSSESNSELDSDLDSEDQSDSVADLFSFDSSSAPREDEGGSEEMGGSDDMDSLDDSDSDDESDSELDSLDDSDDTSDLSAASQPRATQYAAVTDENDLTVEAVWRPLSALNDTKQDLGYFDVPSRLPSLALELAEEVLPLFMELKSIARVKSLVDTLDMLCANLPADPEGLTAFKYYNISQHLRKYSKYYYKMFSCACNRFMAIQAWNGALETLFKQLLQQMLDVMHMLLQPPGAMGAEPDEDDEEQAGLLHLIKTVQSSISQAFGALQAEKPRDFSSFEYIFHDLNIVAPQMSHPVKPLIHPSFCEIPRCNDLLADFIVDKYYHAADAKTKTLTLALADVSRWPSDRLMSTLLPLACAAARDSNEDLAVAGYTLMVRLARLVSRVADPLVAEVVEVALQGLKRYPRGALFLIHVITNVLSYNNTASDETLAQLNAKVLELCKTPKRFLSIEAVKAKQYNALWKLGSVFKDRFAQYLPAYRTAILELACCAVEQTYTAELTDGEFDFTGTPVISVEHRLRQYVLLGHEALGDAFDSEAQDFVQFILQHRDKYRIRVPQFHALFGNILYRLYRPQPDQLATHTMRVLDVFKEEVVQCGYGNVLNNEQYLEHELNGTNSYLPYTYAQFCSAVVEFRKAGSKRAKKKMHQIFTFKRPIIPEDPATVYLAVNKFLKSNAKSASINHAELKNIAKEELNKTKCQCAIECLTTHLELVPDNCLQQTLHVFLAHARTRHSCDTLGAAITAYERLKPQLTYDSQQFYVAIMASVLANITKKDSCIFRKSVCYSLCNKLADLYFEWPRQEPNVADFLFKVTIQLGSVASVEKYPNIIYNFVKRLIDRAPRTAKTVFEFSSATPKLFRNEAEDEQFSEHLHAIALLGYHFGIHYLRALRNRSAAVIYRYNTLNFEDLPALCIKQLKTAHDAEVTRALQTLIVLHRLDELSGGDSESLCLYTAPYDSVNALPVILDLLHSPGFTLGSAELDAQVQAWKAIYDLNTIT